ncbi:hypothetical protein FQN60_009303 [Etheostoma spectabile]|uniref:Uncharacterized protein n=1 Tax=Etheostoma spectabile TaxID=54343 RepID=A0A5J5DIL4_9PERO|nr:hypothetical protein FQN60_009303 [Etheostoma spectabile]
MDIWSSRTMEPYIASQSTILMPISITGQNITNGLREALAAWGLNEEKLICITSDNASNIKLAAELNGWIRLQCFSTDSTWL